MANNCNVAVGGIKLDPACDALRAPGGIKKEAYIGSLSELAGYTTDATSKDIATLLLKAGAKLGKLIGRKLKNSTSTGLEANENITLFPHSFVFVAYAKTQLDKETIEKLSKVEDLFAIVHNNDGTFEAFGLAGENGVLGNGLSMTALEHGSGTALTDGRPWTLTFSGSESKLPINVSLGVDEIATLAELEAMHTTAAV
ncbi:hypothetical protein [Rufibacter latericius]|uniref:Uncharacterized protein n=1 Tax=Rufibacter latericius TaxID=2487040 RepID=A0A3M9MM67_9BACT|nr:hypothetical protein [Rufibacter latericius]RNI26634.1 hypothetical protein EFB08_11490 [Rufibacter latericius]